MGDPMIEHIVYHHFGSSEHVYPINLSCYTPIDESNNYVFSLRRFTHPENHRFTTEGAEQRMTTVSGFLARCRAVFGNPCTPVEASRAPSTIEAARLHNHTQSGLHALPTEQLLIIFEYLPQAARLSLERVSHRLRTAGGLLNPDPAGRLVKMTNTECVQLTHLLRRDKRVISQSEYNKRCDAANSDSDIARLGCSSCLTVHEPGYFFELQLALPANLRICKALERDFKLCSHVSINGRCLARVLDELGDAEIRCLHKEHDYSPSGQSCRPRLAHLRPLERPCLLFYRGRSLTISWVTPLLPAPVPVRGCNNVYSVLSQLEIIICPHLRTDSGNLFTGKRLRVYTARGPMRMDGNFTAPSWWWGLRLWKDWIGPSFDPSFTEWFRCTEESCYTRYCLIYDWVSQAICFHISRDMFGGPTHQSWKGHTEIGLSPWREVEMGKTDCRESLRSCRGVCCVQQMDRLLSS